AVHSTHRTCTVLPDPDMYKKGHSNVRMTGTRTFFISRSARWTLLSLLLCLSVLTAFRQDVTISHPAQPCQLLPPLTPTVGVVGIAKLTTPTSTAGPGATLPICIRFWIPGAIVLALTGQFLNANAQVVHTAVQTELEDRLANFELTFGSLSPDPKKD